MRKLFLVTLMLMAFTVGAYAQGGAPEKATNDIPNMGRAPREADGIGRLDLRVVDEAGNPVQGVQAHLESKRAGGFVCESWNSTDARGVSVLPPLHMGKLKLTLKAKGFATQKIEVFASDLGEPVRVTLHRK
jgi:hypothetical protein